MFHKNIALPFSQALRIHQGEDLECALTTTTNHHLATFYDNSERVQKYAGCFNPILPEGGGAKYAPLLFFLHHPKTAQGITLKLSDFKDTLLRHILQVKPVR